MVAVFAHARAVRGRALYGKQVDPGTVAPVALYHDASEILTGDLPTPVKYQNPDILEAYKKVEAGAAGRLLSMLPEALCPAYQHLLGEEDEQTTQLVKAADKLSAYVKCLEELKAGNNEFRSAAQQTLASLQAIDLPELTYFMEQFLPSFSRTLDELQYE